TESGRTAPTVPHNRSLWWPVGTAALLLLALPIVLVLTGVIPLGQGDTQTPVTVPFPAVKPEAPESLGAPRVTPFLAGGATRKQPVWSPAGNLIAYVSDEAGNDDIWICDPSGANPLNLTANFKGVDAQPSWSPDGQRLAFFSERDGGGIYITSVLGGNA